MMGLQGRESAPGKTDLSIHLSFALTCRRGLSANQSVSRRREVYAQKQNVRLFRRLLCILRRDRLHTDLRAESGVDGCFPEIDCTGKIFAERRETEKP